MNEIIRFITIAALPLIFAITLHEAAHGYIAYLLGDKTAYMLGRVTLNPAKHIDPIGTIVVPGFMLIMSTMVFGGGMIFGWAKPVPVTWQNLRRPRLDMALVALAGPAANLIMMFLWALVAKVSHNLIIKDSNTAGIYYTFLVFLFAAGSYGIVINALLMLLNLLPIPPLDGSRVVSSIIPPKWDYYYSRLEQYGLWILLALVFLGVLSSIILPPMRFLIVWVHNIFNIPL